MAHYLPPALMGFFRAPPPLPYKPPVEKRQLPPYSGVSMWLHRFKDPVPEPVVQETPQGERLKRVERKRRKAQKRLEKMKAKWDPSAPSEKVTPDAYKTLFVGRLPYELEESDIKTEFEYYGPVSMVRLVRDRKGKSRGYAFIQFESDRDFEAAYKDADGRKIRGRRIVVDVERGRTVKGFLPVRLGGTLGGASRRGKRVIGREVFDVSDSRGGGGDGGGGSRRPPTSGRRPPSDQRSRYNGGRSSRKRSRSYSPPRRRPPPPPPRDRGYRRDGYRDSYRDERDRRSSRREY